MLGNLEIYVKILAMTKRVKRWLFYSAVAVFLLLSYVVILYAQGYKYSFKETKFLRTGAIALKANTAARVFLNSNLEGETSFFNNSFSVDRLLPGRYKITVQKDNYSSWSKNLTVEGGLVVDFSNILLLPEEGEEEQELFEEVRLLFKELEPIATLKPTLISEITDGSFVVDLKNQRLLRRIGGELEELAQNVGGFRLSKNKNKIAWWTNNEIWVMWLTDQNYQPFHKKEGRELITRFQISIQNGTWFRGEDHLVLELEQIDSKGRPYSIYRVIETDKRNGVNIIEL